MIKTTTSLNLIKLVGMAVRTSTAQEMNPATAKIGPTMHAFLSTTNRAAITDRTDPGKVFAVYTNYGADEQGPYTYFVGEEVAALETIPEGFDTMIIPDQSYIKLTTEPGPMPDVCIQMWQRIWAMSPRDLGGKRAFKADFEVYDARCHDLGNAVLDIYIGID